MRIATLGLLAVLASASGAAAADLDYGYLRGAEDDYAPAPIVDWSGLYVGGHGGYSSGAFGFPNRYGAIASSYLAKIGHGEIFGNGDPNHPNYPSALMSAANGLQSLNKRAGDGSFGLYVGANYQFDDIVIGIEGDYTSSYLKSQTFDAVNSAFVANASPRGLHAEGISTTQLLDYGTIRARAGYAFGSFLPYVTGGVAIGRAKIAQSLSTTIVSDQNIEISKIEMHETNFGGTNSVASGTSLSKIKTMGGIALGAGLEFAITSNLLLRGEYQYVMFDDFDGHKLNINTVRGGAAVKF